MVTEIDLTGDAVAARQMAVATPIVVEGLGVWSTLDARADEPRRGCQTEGEPQEAPNPEPDRGVDRAVEGCDDREEQDGEFHGERGCPPGIALVRRWRPNSTKRKTAERRGAKPEGEKVSPPRTGRRLNTARQPESR
jgi:hypothetical protein